jgi:hypothetical protein
MLTASKNYSVQGFESRKTAVVALSPDYRCASEDRTAHITSTFFMSPEEARAVAKLLVKAAKAAEKELAIALDMADARRRLAAELDAAPESDSINQP